MDDIHVSEDKSYTLSEVIDAVKQTLDAVSEQSGHRTNSGIPPPISTGSSTTCSDM